MDFCRFSTICSFLCRFSTKGNKKALASFDARALNSFELNLHVSTVLTSYFKKRLGDLS